MKTKRAKTLVELAMAITKEEGLRKSISIGQVSEVLGILGRRWRSLSTGDALIEIAMIELLAGLRGEHVGKARDKARAK